jgi:hypothetical protein
MAPRTIGALAMRPTGKTQGNYYFFSLSTGQIINRAHATQLPMPDDVIECMHAQARCQKASPSLVFLDRNQMPDGAINEHDSPTTMTIMMTVITWPVTMMILSASTTMMTPMMTMLTTVITTPLRMAERMTLTMHPLKVHSTTHQQVVEMMTSNRPK